MKNTAIKNDLYLPFMRRYTQTAVSCIATINDKSFNSEKFRGLRYVGKSFAIFFGSDYIFVQLSRE